MTSKTTLYLYAAIQRYAARLGDALDADLRDVMGILEHEAVAVMTATVPLANTKTMRSDLRALWRYTDACGAQAIRYHTRIVDDAAWVGTGAAMIRYNDPSFALRLSEIETDLDPAPLPENVIDGLRRADWRGIDGHLFGLLVSQARLRHATDDQATIIIEGTTGQIAPELLMIVLKLLGPIKQAATDGQWRLRLESEVGTGYLILCKPPPFGQTGA